MSPLKQIVVIGCGGFGREVLDVVDAINITKPTWHVTGVVDDAPSAENLTLLASRGVKYLGTTDTALTLEPQHFVVGIGSGLVRRQLDTRFTEAGWNAATLVHPSATFGHAVSMAPGAVICAGVRMTTNIQIGRHSHVNLNSTIGHDASLADYVTVNPLVAVSGWVRIGTETMIGTHAAVLQNLVIGDRSVIGGASLVTKDVPDDVVVKGVPAR